MLPLGVEKGPSSRNRARGRAESKSKLSSRRISMKQIKEQKMRIVLSILLITMIFPPAWAQTRAALADVEKPKVVCVTADRFYIVEESCVVRVYSRKDNTSLKIFGKKGQGPGEFAELPYIKPLETELFVSSPGKISIFSFEGRLREEKKSLADLWKVAIEPAGERFVTKKMEQRPDKKEFYFEECVYLYDKDFVNKKLLYSAFVGKEGQKISFLPSRISFHVDKDRIFVAETDKGMVIEVFDLTGNPIGRINGTYEKRKIDKAFKQEREDKFTRDGTDKNYFEWPDYYPAMSSFFADNERIWVKTYNRNRDNIEFILFDLKGKELKKIFLPDGDELYAFFKDFYYCLKYNLLKETWEWLTVSLADGLNK
jgi:hypothetical protein